MNLKPAEPNQIIYNPDNIIFPIVSNAFGGTEFMAKNFKEKVLPYIPKIKKYNCVLLPGKRIQSYDEMLYDDREIIIWIHNLQEQFGNPKNEETARTINKMFTNLDFIKKIKYVIVVSEYAKLQLMESSNIEESRIIVIYNAMNPSKNNNKKFIIDEKIKIIHTSAAERGFSVIANSLKYIEDDFRIDIFNDIHPDLDFISKEFQEIYKDERLFFHYKTPKKTVMDYLSQAHIFAYPCIYKETFCLSQTEAISAGCLPVYRNYASLPEVSMNSGVSYEIDNDDPMSEEHAKLFASKLKYSIDLIKNKKFNPEEKIKEINEKFSWENFKQSWINLHEKL
jgi:glycosyltransferase involved in cell wall biosynthesis